MRLAKRIAHRAGDLRFFPAMDRHWRKQLEGTLRCLLYHRVQEVGALPFLDRFGAPPIAPDDFAAEMDFYSAQGARFMTFADLRAGEFPGKSEFGVIVSFDDGMLDSYTEALAILHARGIRGMVFQSSALVDAKSLIWEHELYFSFADDERARAVARLVHRRLPELSALSGSSLLAHLREAVPASVVESILEELRDSDVGRPTPSANGGGIYPRAADLRAAVAAGHEIGSHGHHHYKRTSITAAEFEQELAMSVDSIEQVSGVRPLAFSYPFNSYVPGDRAICARHFTQVATVDATCIKATNDPLTIPRFSWHGPPRSRLRHRRWLWTGRI